MTPERVLQGTDRWCVVERDARDVLATLPTESIDAVITDPPYGIAYKSSWVKDGVRFGEIIGDDWPMVEFLPAAVRVAKIPAPLFVFCEWRHSEAFRIGLERAGAVVRSQCVWDREQHGMGDLGASFAPCHDLAWFATKGDGFKFYGSRPQTVLRFQKVSPTKLVHPCEKPVALMRHLIATLTKPNDVVLDPFGGSGSTAVAAVMEGRRVITCELDRQYAFTARRRIEAAEAVTDHRVPQQGGLFVPKKPLPKEGLTA